MREELQKIKNVRATFRGIVVRFGEKPGFRNHAPKKTMLVQDIRDRHNRVLTDHLWFMCGKWSDALDLQEGDEIQFDARVTSYLKGYRGRREDDDLPPVERDYRLSHPTKVKKIRIPAPAVEIPDRPVGPMPKVQESLFA